MITRRLRLTLGIVTTMALVGLADSGTAEAQDRSGILTPRHREVGSPQNFAIEARLSLYQPEIDSEPGLVGKPYASTFGDMRRALVGFEFDWQALRIPHFGSIGPGVAASYTVLSAPTYVTGTTTPAREETSLEVFPFYGVAVLRLDLLNHDLHIPIVPFAKAGVGYALWRSYTDAGTASSVDPVSGKNQPAKGATWGTHAAAGLALDLNAFDGTAARNFDNSMGVNHTYIFAEYTWMNLRGLGGQKAPLYVGGTSWTFGLAFEF